MQNEIKIGIFPPLDAMGGQALPQFLRDTADAGLDHVATGDHVSFFVGFGVDGLINATALAAMERTLGVYVSVYLLALRHPVLVARQISTFSTLAPDRLTLGIGVGGEDRHEVEVCGVDPATRGRRTDECLQILRLLMAGRPVTFEGEFFNLDAAHIIPAPATPPPLVIGGRSDAAIRRAGLYGDGWIGTWVSADRFAHATSQIEDIATKAGRNVEWRHAVQTWCGFGDDLGEARDRVASAMQGLYRIPFEKFEKWSPYGTPGAVADSLRPYVDAGCRTFNLLPQAASARDAIEASAEVKRILTQAVC